MLEADYFHQGDALDAVTREELIDRLATGDMMILDGRPEDEFALGHMSGALNIPLGELEARLMELPRDKDIVAYCRRTYGVLSFEAVVALRARRYKVRRLEAGMPEWRTAGLETIVVA